MTIRCEYWSQPRVVRNPDFVPRTSRRGGGRRELRAEVHRTWAWVVFNPPSSPYVKSHGAAIDSMRRVKPPNSVKQRNRMKRVRRARGS